MKVAIIGAGVTCLQVATILKQGGIECTIFEKAGDITGLWNKNYAGFALQVPKELYEFPGFPWPAGKRMGALPKGTRRRRIHQGLREGKRARRQYQAQYRGCGFEVGRRWKAWMGARAHAR
jgi:cation diffusion facilitator CzcD-associated flavoprotein CzcO